MYVSVKTAFCRNTSISFTTNIGIQLFNLCFCIKCYTENTQKNCNPLAENVYEQFILSHLTSVSVLFTLEKSDFKFSVEAIINVLRRLHQHYHRVPAVMENLQKSWKMAKVAEVMEFPWNFI